MWTTTMDRDNIRHMIRRDLPEIMEIENASFRYPWTEDDFIRTLRQRNCIGMVAEEGDKIVGHMIYELHKNRLHLLALAVHPSHRRCSIGRNMVNKLIGKLSHERRNRIMLEVSESNLAAHLFFKSMGFKAIQVLRGFYEDTRESAYLMQYRCKETDAENKSVMDKIWKMR